MRFDDVRTMQRKSLREPSRAWVVWPDCAERELRVAFRKIDEGNARMAEATGYKKLPEPSAMEVWLLGAFFYYELYPDCQWNIGPFWVDFYFEEANLAIEVDGRDWHKDAKREAKRDSFIRGTDTRIKHFWGSEVYRDPLWCARQVIWTMQDIRNGVPAAA